MRFTLSLFIDVALILLATVCAILVRDNFEISVARFTEFSPYLIATAITSIVAIPLLGLNKVIWRFSSLPDYLRAGIVMLLVVFGSVAIAFAYHRLEGVPRSLPLLQFNLGVMLLVGLRVFYRLHHTARKARRQAMAPLRVVDEPADETMLLVGLSRLTETYLQAITELGRGKIKIAGIVGQKDRQVGRRVAAHKILGLPDDIEAVLSDLEVNGIFVDKIIVTTSFASLSQSAREALNAIERAGPIRVIYVSEKLGLETAPQPQIFGVRPIANPTPRSNTVAKFEIRADDLDSMRERPYWKIKRLIDVTIALSLLLLVWPVLILVAVGVAASMGIPLMFWQQRPGLGGRPFRLYKFRSMGAAQAPDGRRLSDAERVSRMGSFLRRTRLDELPQLINILRGEMSFIGPRPLLPRDQDGSCRARLLVRPGLTGWAQVVGGRSISPDDKAALDIWYVKNASLALDLAIALRTVPIVLKGERTSESLIRRAWRDLWNAGVLKEDFSNGRSRQDPRHRVVVAQI